MQRNSLLWVCLLAASVASAAYFGARLRTAKGVIAQLKTGEYTAEVDRLKAETERLEGKLAVTGKKLKETRRDRDFWRKQARSGGKVSATAAPDAPSEEHAPLGAGLGDDSRDAVIRAVLLGNGSDRWKELSRVGLDVSGEDFRKAIAGLTTSGADRRKLQTALRDWATVDPKGLADWIASQPQSRNVDDAVRHLLARWVRNDAKAAAAWVEALPDGTRKDRALHSFIQQAAPADPVLAADWYAKIKDPNLRRSVASQIARAWGKTDPKAAAEWVLTLTEAGTRDYATRSLSFSLARSDPPFAIAWAEGIESQSLRESTIVSAVGAWSAKDPKAAGEYIASLEEGAFRDQCIRRFAGQLAREYPATAMDWALAIADARSRDSTVSSVAFRWMRTDIDAALEWVAQADLSDDTRRRLYQSASNIVNRTNRRGHSGEPWESALQ